ncbi:MAG: ATP-binding protein, partial [Anaerolineae bacterium]|nr:ATP-binding protein [Anaerolineae bacterium]
IKDASDIAEQTLRRIRLISYDLRPPELDTLGLNEALEAYCEEFAQRTRLTIRYEGVELPGLIDAIRISLYRFLQEGLTNVVKHAEANAVDVRLSYDGQEVCLTISDDGRGFVVPARVGANNASLGLGLLGMKERLAQLGGSLTIQSRLREGTDLIACAPWEGPSLREGPSP